MRVHTFPSSSNPDVVYTAKVADDGKLLCNCKGWTMRRGDSPRHCTHTKKIAAGADVAIRGEFVYLRDGVLPEPPLNGISGIRPITLGAPAPMLASAHTTPVTGKAFDRQFASRWAMEEKLDGHRCVAVVVDGVATAYSRPRAGADGANVRELPAHIGEQLRRFPDGVYDGELVAPGGKAWNVVERGAQLVFVIFDLLRVEHRSLIGATYTERRAQLLDILAASLTPNQRAISTVESLTPSWAAIEAIWQRGGEGAILKRTDSSYRPGYRSPEWVKVKQQRHATLTITGFAVGKSGPCSVMQLRDRDGVETTVKVLGNELLRKVTAAPQTYIGRRVVITFQEKTNGGTYRHGIFDHFAGEGE